MDIDERYKNGKIYILKSPHTNNFYIGSSIVDLEQRKRRHEADYRGFKGITPQFRNYRSSFKVIEDGDHFIELIENYPCCNKKELEMRETEYFLFYKNKFKNDCVNMNIPRKYDPELLLFHDIKMI